MSAPIVGWRIAEELKNKCYYDEILFYLHLHVASVCTRSLTKQSAGTDIAASQCKEQLASKNNRTFKILSVLSLKLKQFL